jgi:hypothetical protein
MKLPEVRLEIVDPSVPGGRACYVNSNIQVLDRLCLNYNMPLGYVIDHLVKLDPRVHTIILDPAEVRKGYEASKVETPKPRRMPETEKELYRWLANSYNAGYMQGVENETIKGDKRIESAELKGYADGVASEKRLAEARRSTPYKMAKQYQTLGYRDGLTRALKLLIIKKRKETIAILHDAIAETQAELDAM